jgi:predicted acylesterase/phospholipase RssA
VEVDTVKKAPNAMKQNAPRIGVVLSSGGVRGVYAHTGFLLALARLGIPIAASAGCSAGAVVGGIAASGADLTAWSDALARVDRHRFWTPDPWPVLLWRFVARKGRGYTGLSGTETALEFCRRHLSVQTFAECRYPFHALAVSLRKGRKVMFSHGELAPRVVASAAMPILYRPVAIDGDWYCDGALVDLAPMDAICCKHRLDALLIHHVASRHTDVADIVQREWSMLGILERLLFRHRPWYLSEERLTFHRCPCHCGAAVVVIEPQLPELPWPATAGGSAVQAAAAAQATELLQPHLEALLTDPSNRLPGTNAASIGASNTEDRLCEH